MTGVQTCALPISLKAQIAENTTVIGSALILIRALQAQLAAAPSGSQVLTDMAAALKLQSLFSKMR